MHRDVTAAGVSLSVLVKDVCIVRVCSMESLRVHIPAVCVCVCVCVCVSMHVSLHAQITQKC